MTTYHICDDPGATDDWGSPEGHLRSHEVTIRIFTNNSRQDGGMDAQMVPNDLSRQADLWDMHIDLLGSWPDLALTWGQILKWTFQDKKCMWRTGLTRRTGWCLFHLYISHIKMLSIKNDLGENDNFSFDDLRSQNCWTLVKSDLRVLPAHEESSPMFLFFQAIIPLETIAIVCEKKRFFSIFDLWWPLVTSILNWPENSLSKSLRSRHILFYAVCR